MTEEITRIIKEQKAVCSVCGNHKASCQEYCKDCLDYKKTVEELRKTNARIKAFGALDGF